MSDEQKLLAACADYRAKLDKLETDNAALNETTKKHVSAYYELMAENAELREDKARLDWLDVNPFDRMGNVEYYWSNHGDIDTIRKAIDAARNGVQP